MWAPDRIERPTTSTSSCKAAVTIISGSGAGRVDDLETLVAQAAREHFGAAVVAVEAGLRNQDLDRAFAHGADDSAAVPAGARGGAGGRALAGASGRALAGAGVGGRRGRRRVPAGAASVAGGRPRTGVRVAPGFLGRRRSACLRGASTT